MKSYSLNIADYIIEFKAGASGPDLVPSQRFSKFLCQGRDPDITISVKSDRFMLPDDAKRVFHAPLAEDRGTGIVTTSDNFWSVYQLGTDLFIKTIFPGSVTGKEAILKFSTGSRQWDLHLLNAGSETDPLEYPLDGLVIYYLTAISGAIMIHASGVNISGTGFLFSGVSGKGKSTMARLWNSSGAKIIHDDRLIVRNISGRFSMFNTPVYDNDAPAGSPLNGIFLIEHGKENIITPVNGAAAVSLTMANCIQHGWNKDLIAGMLNSVSSLCSAVPVMKLSFRPDAEITSFIRKYDKL